MRSKSQVALMTLAGALLVSADAAAKPAAPGVTTYMIRLTGQAEISNVQTTHSVGDRDGSGQVRLSVDPARKQVCYDFTVSKLATPLMAHIHKGPRPRNGPSVITLFTGSGGDLNDCVMWTEKRLAEIVANPSNFYVNLYTTEYPDGALRGQLVG